MREEDPRRFAIHADSLRNDVRLLSPGKQLTFKIGTSLFNHALRSFAD